MSLQLPSSNFSPLRLLGSTDPTATMTAEEVSDQRKRSNYRVTAVGNLTYSLNSWFGWHGGDAWTKPLL